MKAIPVTCVCALVLAVAVSTVSGQVAPPPQASGSDVNAKPVLKVSNGYSFMAKLMSPIVIGKASTDDTIEAQTTQDIKGHDVVLKKGSTLVGHVQSLQPPTSERPEYYVVMVFDRVRPKNGEEMRLELIIQALAPESDRGESQSIGSTGTGLQGATRNAGVTGHSSATQGNINALTTSSNGVIDIAGLAVGEKISGDVHYTVLASRNKDLQLKKGTQLVMKVVGQ